VTALEVAFAPVEVSDTTATIGEVAEALTAMLAHGEPVVI
jgi:hypothetical protein